LGYQVNPEGDVMEMAKEDMTYFKERLDKIFEISYQNNSELVGIREHLKTLNGKVASHEQRFTDVYQEFKNQSAARALCQEKIASTFEKVKDEATKDSRKQEREIWGVKIKLIGLVTILTTIVTGVLNYFIIK